MCDNDDRDQICRIDIDDPEHGKDRNFFGRWMVAYQRESGEGEGDKAPLLAAISYSPFPRFLPAPTLICINISTPTRRVC